MMKDLKQAILEVKVINRLKVKEMMIKLKSRKEENKEKKKKMEKMVKRKSKKVLINKMRLKMNYY